MQVMLNEHADDLKEVFEFVQAPRGVCSTVATFLSKGLDKLGCDLTSADEFNMMCTMLQRRETPQPYFNFSERYLHELRSCISDKLDIGIAKIQRVDELGLIILFMGLDRDRNNGKTRDRSRKDWKSLQEDYNAVFKEADLEKEVLDAVSDSGMLETLLFGLAGMEPGWLWARTLYEAIEGGLTGLGTDEETLTDVICLNRHCLDSLKDNYLKVSAQHNTTKTLRQAIMGDTSGKYQILLSAMLDHYAPDMSVDNLKKGQPERESSGLGPDPLV